MSTRLKEKEEKIQHVLEALAEESARKIPVIVEGKNDVDVLRQFGVSGPVLCLKTGGKSFCDALYEVEQTGAQEVILLLDFDRRGREGTRRLKQNLERAQVKPNTVFWRSLSALLARDIQCIEGLGAYMETLKRKAM
ncbi:MAG TPA: toprim domain-containing protein [Candidatus Bathyarchaeia archaeon]|nr:toprim domain-containing protein [Candidatus Bathyarchaeia archaeon]